MIRLFHVSEDDSITRFEPRLPPSANIGVTEPSVWAVDEEHLQNYLLPRNCPRVTYYALPTSREDDIKNLIGPGESRHVVAIEAAWFERACKTALWIYEFDSETFSLVDVGAGYHVSKVAVVPQRKTKDGEPSGEACFFRD